MVVRRRAIVGRHADGQHDGHHAQAEGNGEIAAFIAPEAIADMRSSVAHRLKISAYSAPIPPGVEIQAKRVA
jgi:hypothetical protein